MKGGAHHILMIDDSRAEADLVRQALDMSGLDITFEYINKASNAVPYLNSLVYLPLDLKPDLVLLDLNMPGISGMDILKLIKENESLKVMPVIMFSTTKEEDTIKNCYTGKANAYIVKPYEFEGYMDIVKNLCDFWFYTVKLPADQDVY